MSYPNKYLTGATGRQLMDLRKRPSVAVINGVTVPDNRPYFEMGELPESSPEYGKKPWEFRQILYHPTSGEEVCALTQSEVNSYHNRGYLDFPLNGGVVDPVQSARDELEGLTPDERQRVLEAVKRAKLEALQARLMKLSDAELLDVQTAPKPKIA